MDRDASGTWSVAGFLMATALATTISGVAAAQSPAPKIFSNSSASAIQSYWTAQKMAAAKPKGLQATGAGHWHARRGRRFSAGGIVDQ